MSTENQSRSLFAISSSAHSVAAVGLRSGARSGTTSLCADSLRCRPCNVRGRPQTADVSATQSCYYSDQCINAHLVEVMCEPGARAGAGPVGAARRGGGGEGTRAEPAAGEGDGSPRAPHAPHAVVQVEAAERGVRAIIGAAEELAAAARGTPYTPTPARVPKSTRVNTYFNPTHQCLFYY